MLKKFIAWFKNNTGHFLLILFVSVGFAPVILLCSAAICVEFKSPDEAFIWIVLLLYSILWAYLFSQLFGEKRKRKVQRTESDSPLSASRGDGELANNARGVSEDKKGDNDPSERKPEEELSQENRSNIHNIKSIRDMFTTEQTVSPERKPAEGSSQEKRSITHAIESMGYKFENGQYGLNIYKVGAQGYVSDDIYFTITREYELLKTERNATQIIGKCDSREDCLLTMYFKLKNSRLVFLEKGIRDKTPLKSAPKPMVSRRRETS